MFLLLNIHSKQKLFYFLIWTCDWECNYTSDSTIRLVIPLLDLEFRQAGWNEK